MRDNPPFLDLMLDFSGMPLAGEALGGGLDLGVTNLAAAVRKTTRRLLWARRLSYTGS